ncbi:hypothetical protein [Xenorhabdus cabanillasii]|uniref:Uncharacterized protein n=1 Tax=Xenorhabdus cabanillasii JM26 TaxID=1427517 RepID=W1IP34_9GAMM|nr:hypothetical protein [Xenorhabdus cabanillasii]PHM76053.1 hypothetical protein Xcab_03435 [Xenorhabdus cabanillasii JM26]CDL80199.1 hypothetical protein XCR1_1410024 [Xenorhabdus cabanillasii JM26]
MKNTELTLEQKLEIARLATDLTKAYVSAKIPLTHIAKDLEILKQYGNSQFAIFDYLYDQITEKIME